MGYDLQEQLTSEACAAFSCEVKCANVEKMACQRLLISRYPGCLTQGPLQGESRVAQMRARQVREIVEVRRVQRQRPQLLLRRLACRCNTSPLRTMSPGHSRLMPEHTVSDTRAPPPMVLGSWPDSTAAQRSAALYSLLLHL